MSQIEIITIYLASLTYKIKPIYQWSRIKVKKEMQLVQYLYLTGFHSVEML